MLKSVFQPTYTLLLTSEVARRLWAILNLVHLQDQIPSFEFMIQMLCFSITYIVVTQNRVSRIEVVQHTAVLAAPVSIGGTDPPIEHL
jgi:hypothetical protein